MRVVSVPPSPRRKLGRRLYEMRQTAGLSLEAAAEKLDVSRSALSRWERGEAAVTLPVAESMTQLYHRSEPDLPELVRQAQQPDWWHDLRISDQEYVAWETYASDVYEVATTRLPELVQSQPYARARLIGDVEHIRDESTARRRIRDGEHALLLRQYRFVDEPVLRLHAVITEAALRHEVGSGPVLLAQWLYLRWAMSWQVVTLRILPTDATPADLTEFRLLEFADADEPDRLYVGPSQGSTSQRAIARARRRFARFADASLSVADSAEFVQRLIARALTPGSSVRRSA